MKVNRGLLEVTLTNKLKNETFATIVTEAFISSLPIQGENLSKENMAVLTQYSVKTLEAMGGYGVLKHALESETNPKKKTFLKDIANVCESAAKRTTDRILTESAKDNLSTMEEIVGDCGLTQAEQSEFLKASGELDLDRVAEIVKDKVIKTLRSEKEAHQRVEDVNAELNETLKDENRSEEENKIAKESVLRIVVGRNNTPEYHRSFFNTLQSVACEQVLHTASLESLKNDELSLMRLTNITLESTINKLFPNYERTLESALDVMTSMKSASENEELQNHSAEVVEAATVDAIVVYSMLESLHTMNLIDIRTADVKEAMETALCVKDQCEMDVHLINERIQAIVSTIATKNVASIPTEKLPDMIAHFSGIVLRLEECPVDSINPEDVQKIKAYRDALVARQLELERVNTVTTESFVVTRAKEYNCSQLNKIAQFTKMTGPRVTEIVFEQTEEPEVMNVRLTDGRNILSTNHVVMESIGFDGSTSALEALVANSKLCEETMPSIFMKPNDGYGKKVPIK